MTTHMCLKRPCPICALPSGSSLPAPTTPTETVNLPDGYLERLHNDLEQAEARIEQLERLVKGLVEALNGADFDTAMITPEFEGWGGLIEDSDTENSTVSVTRVVAEHLVKAEGWPSRRALGDDQ